jgi:hypothetical protein
MFVEANSMVLKNSSHGKGGEGEAGGGTESSVIGRSWITSSGPSLEGVAVLAALRMSR